SRGFERVLTKVTASSDLKGLWLSAPTGGLARRPDPLDPADEPGVKVLLPEWLSGETHAAILAELAGYEAAQDEAFAQHYSSYNKRHSWTAFALHGYSSGEPDFIIKPAEMSKGWKAENPSRLGAECEPTKAAE